MDYQRIIDKYYPAPSKARDILMRHSRDVANLALEIADRLNMSLDREKIEAAAMLHDIGIFQTYAPSIDCHGDKQYIMHGPLGTDLLLSEGVDQEIALVAQRHTGAGITHHDIVIQGLPLPLDRTYIPGSLLEQLICYADKFYSKSDLEHVNTVDEIVASLSYRSEAAAKNFLSLHELFSGEWTRLTL